MIKHLKNLVGWLGSAAALAPLGFLSTEKFLAEEVGDQAVIETREIGEVELATQRGFHGKRPTSEGAENTLV